MVKSKVWESVQEKRKMGTVMICDYCHKKISTKPTTTIHIVEQDGNFFHKVCFNEKKHI